jgi:hypothetical protein
MGNKILKLHGCSGAGKTTAVRELMLGANILHEVTPDGANKPEAYVLEYDNWDTPIVVLGSYKNNCGGMDSYPSDAPSIIRLIEDWRDEGHVIFEGLLLSTYYGAVGKYLEQFGDDAIFAFMDTPILTCLERVTRRRDVQKSKNKFNPQLTVDKYNAIERLKNKCMAGGRRVISVDHTRDAAGQLLTVIRGAA